MNKRLNHTLGEIVYLLHAGLMILFILSGFIVSLQWVVIIYMLVYLHAYLVRGCAITIVQKHYGWIPKDYQYGYIAHLLERLFKINPASYWVGLTYAVVAILPLLIAVIIHW